MSETTGLLEQLETVRREKHQVEEARARGARRRDTKIEELTSENVRLGEALTEAGARLEKREEEARCERASEGTMSFLSSQPIALE